MSYFKDFRFRSVQEVFWLTCMLTAMLAAVGLSVGAGKVLNDLGDWGLWSFGFLSGMLIGPVGGAAWRRFVRAIPDEDRPGGDA